MSDLISRQAAIDAVDKRFDGIPMEQTQEILLLRRDLRTLPSVQPERKKGKWLKAGTRMGIPLFECSLCECGEEVPTVMGKPSYNFCPNCGCRMEEGE